MELSAARFGTHLVEVLRDNGGVAAMLTPSGTVTFLFTDVEGSTRLWEGHRSAMEAALARHDEILRSSIAACGGFVFSTAGDAFAAAFARSADAVEAALAAQRALQSEAWPAGAEIRVRMGLHVGAAHERDGDYFGPAVNRAARLMGVANGSQVLVSLAVQQLVREELGPGVRLVGLGVRALRGLSEPETVFQLTADDLREHFPALAGSGSGFGLKAGNLPVPATSFVGRVEQVKRLAVELAVRRLVTLFGPGGVGKTRLAIEAAAAAVDEFPDGMWFVELAAVSDPLAVGHAAALALGARAQEGMDPIDALVEALTGRRALLVLDNAEHVVAAVADLASAVLSKAPTASLLVTSREPLGVAGEQVWPVPSLDPVLEGVELFCERAALADAAFAPGDRDQQVMAAICARLDGIPLAIELAAAQVRSMTLSDIADRLDHRFRLLRGPRRGGGLERHQTLRATIDWSYRLLDEHEALLFDRLSVFAGSFDLAAVDAVCSDQQLDPADLFDVLAALSDRSMLSVERTGPHVRWRLLETLRQYGEERLDHRGEIDLRRDRHLSHFVTVAQDAHRAYAGTDAAAGAAAFEAAWDNLRAALGYAISSGDTARAAAIVEASIWYSYFGLKPEHADWVAQAREVLPLDPSLTGMAAIWAALQGDQQSAAALGEASVAAAPSPQAALFGMMAIVYANFYSGRHEQMGDGARAVDAAAAANPDPFVRAVVASFSCLGTFYEDRASGLVALERTQGLAAQLGNGVALGFASYQAGNIHFEIGSYNVALVEYERCVELASRNGARLHETWARTMLAARATDAGWPDAERRFAETLRYLGANRVWSRAYGVLAALADRWAAAGRIEPAANLIGFLEVQDPIGLLLVATQRARAQVAVNAHPTAPEWKAEGARIERTAIIDFALNELGEEGDI